MKFLNLKQKTLMIFLIAVSLVPISCSSTEEAGAGDELEDSENENAANANANANESENTENYSENSNYNENYNEDYSEANGESVNNAEGDDLVDNINEGQQAMTSNNSWGENDYTDDAYPSNEEFAANPAGGDSFSDPLSNTSANGAFSAPVADESFMGNGTANSAAAPINGTMAPANSAYPVTDSTQMTNSAMPMSPARSGWYVKYATQSISVHRSPGGNVVNQLEEGDHPLVVDENDWARTSEGYYIPQSGLSPNPVGRPRKGINWQ